MNCTHGPFKLNPVARALVRQIRRMSSYRPPFVSVISLGDLTGTPDHWTILSYEHIGWISTKLSVHSYIWRMAFGLSRNDNSFVTFSCLLFIAFWNFEASVKRLNCVIILKKKKKKWKKLKDIFDEIQKWELKVISFWKFSNSIIRWEIILAIWNWEFIWKMYDGKKSNRNVFSHWKLLK